MHFKFGQIYFYRDKTGKEVDLIINTGQNHIPIEIKAAQTFNKEFTKNLDYYKNITSSEVKGNLIYNGETQNQTKHNIYNFYDLLDLYSANGLNI